MPRSTAVPANVVILHPELPRLTARDRARLELIELFRALDPESQRVLVGQLEATQARIRRLTPTARLVRGERGPVSWRPGTKDLWLVAPTSRAWLRRRANG